MDKVTRQDLVDLLSAGSGNCISLTMPLHVGPQMRQDGIRLKNLLTDAEQQLIARGLDADQAAAITAPLSAAAADNAWWEQGGRGFAAFLADGYQRYFRLSRELKEKAAAGDSFAVKPLIPSLNTAGHWYILGLSENHPRLLLATESDVAEIEIEGAPASLNAYMRVEDRQEQLQMHSTGSPQSGNAAGMFHGSSGSWNDEEKEQIPLYLKALGDAVDNMLRADGAPLLLAGVSELQGHFRRQCPLPYLAETGLEGNVDDLSPRQLQLAAWDKVQPVLNGWENAAIARVDELLGTASATGVENEVVVACAQGRVDTLLVAEDAELWGSFDDATQTAKIADGPAGSNVDLSEFATAATLQSSGVVFCVPQAKIPGGSRVAATLRF